ncbi:hypothetical protein SRB5_12260 [Streptomyces sp. RB5]|uniref:DNA-binding protein n=1 Tax=Streptomyces smaragdinus TaxID=2585196 RepID=A0A7K0CDG1_9ACTN|nr:SCO2523 family variant P-loop protein [Streptomyces smaragdinus]MQY11112.1 hypothetical protein [Streptomyces smaragdinus]
MLLFSASDKGGTGRSVTSANLAYRRALSGDDVCYLDFDFGSPTAAAVFDVPRVVRGVTSGGLHSYLQGDVPEPMLVDVWADTEHEALRTRPLGSGRMVLLPGDSGGGEFALGHDTVGRCVSLLQRLEEEYDLVMVDLSAGRSYAVDMVLAATAQPGLAELTSRWLVFHRWTRQHVIAASGLVYGDRGILAAGVGHGHDGDELREAIRFVRAAVPDPEAVPWNQVPAAQVSWMRKCDEQLMDLAARLDAADSRRLGTVPLEPVLQWREVLITDEDADSGVANTATRDALVELAGKLTLDEEWGER